MAVLWNSMIQQKTVIDGLTLDTTGTIPLDGEGLPLARRLPETDPLKVEKVSSI